jgi:hypothetical protein
MIIEIEIIKSIEVSLGRQQDHTVYSDLLIKNIMFIYQKLILIKFSEVMT